MSSEDVPEPVEARPWTAEDGPWPAVTVYPAADRPALWVWSAGRWRRGEVYARQIWRPSARWPQGRLVYQVSVDLRGDALVRLALYEWPQPGLRVEPGESET
ncbi:hypothetical protein [Streptomyces misionensis]|uniref:hypothetical protein n=1 Tax=Streptomyces misionensis TaxID=67331 RepID=UPI0034043C72